ncbi:MAG: helix-turn-helix transcriptional regulator [Lachnospiraceae bacterium]
MKEFDATPVIDMEAIGQRIKRLRNKQHLRVTDISDRMGFETPQAVYKWQRGDCLPETVNLIMLSRMLGTTVEGIVLGDEDVPFFCC